MSPCTCMFELSFHCLVVVSRCHSLYDISYIFSHPPPPKKCLVDLPSRSTCSKIISVLGLVKFLRLNVGCQASLSRAGLLLVWFFLFLLGGMRVGVRVWNEWMCVC